MKNSIFTKYISAFLVIIFLCFTILVTIVGTMNLHSENEGRKNNAKNSAAIISEYIDLSFKSFKTPMPFEKFVSLNSFDLSKLLGVICSNQDDETIFIVSVEGNILVSSDNKINGVISDSDVKKIINSNTEGVVYSNLNGILDSQSSIYVSQIRYSKNQDVCGAIIVCYSMKAADPLTLNTVKTIILVSIWIMILSFVVIYFITEKITSPLKQMNKAIKQFSKGRFDVRVPVKGSDEIAELAIEFNKMADSLTGLEHMRNSFLANVSHDLRTPMTTIAGYIDGILDGAIPDDKRDYYLGVIAGEVRRLSRLVSSILDISRIQAGDRKFEKKDFDICEMLRLILISFENKIEEKNLEIEFNGPDESYVFSDKDAIYQVLYNICDNAMKFSYDNARYIVSIKEGSKQVAISVFNEGIGISEEDIGHIFERFYKSDKSRGLDKNGVGLGMYISKTIIDSLGEQIFVKSEYTKNCEFTIILEKGKKEIN